MAVSWMVMATLARGEPVREYRPEKSLDAAAESTVMAEIAAIKSMLGSIQGSLITSVGLIQGQDERRRRSGRTETLHFFILFR